MSYTLLSFLFYLLFIWSLLQQFLFCSSTSCFFVFPSWTNIPVIPAVTPCQAQEHKLSAPCGPTDRAVCKIIMTHWTCNPVKVRPVELHAPKSCRYQDWSGIPNRQPHTKIHACVHTGHREQHRHGTGLTQMKTTAMASSWSSFWLVRLTDC